MRDVHLLGHTAACFCHCTLWRCLTSHLHFGLYNVTETCVMQKTMAKVVNICGGCLSIPSMRISGFDRASRTTLSKTNAGRRLFAVKQCYACAQSLGCRFEPLKKGGEGVSMFRFSIRVGRFLGARRRRRASRTMVLLSRTKHALTIRTLYVSAAVDKAADFELDPQPS